MSVAPVEVDKISRTLLSFEKMCGLKLTIYDLTGKLINTLVNYDQQANHFTVQWNGLNLRGTPASAGLYFCSLQITIDCAIINCSNA